MRRIRTPAHSQAKNMQKHNNSNNNDKCAMTNILPASATTDNGPCRHHCVHSLKERSKNAKRQVTQQVKSIPGPGRGPSAVNHVRATPFDGSSGRSVAAAATVVTRSVTHVSVKAERVAAVMAVAAPVIVSSKHRVSDRVSLYRNYRYIETDRIQERI